jgi:hypothetical protein
MTPAPLSAKVSRSERRAMNGLFTVIVFAFVFAVLAAVAYALFEMSPFAHHLDRFRDSRTGERLGRSPRLD